MFHSRIEAFHERFDIVRYILCIGNIIIIYLCQKIFAKEFLYHIVGRADHVVIGCIILDHRIHFFVGVKEVYHHIIARGLFESLLQFRIEIISEAVDIQSTFFTFCIFASAADD